VIAYPMPAVWPSKMVKNSKASEMQDFAGKYSIHSFVNRNSVVVFIVMLHPVRIVFLCWH